MTGQVPDTVQFQNVEYMVLAVYPDEPFTPAHIGLTPSRTCTACHRGYVCNFEVTDKLFRLKSLDLSIWVEKEMPVIFGKSGNTQPEINSVNTWEYKDLDYTLPFSGEILFGRSDEVYRASWHGYTRAWECEEVWYLKSIDGQVSKLEDVSKIFERFRELYLVEFCDIRDSEYAKGKPASDEYTIRACPPENRQKYLQFLRRRFDHRFNI